MSKINVEVIAKYDLYGQIKPLAILWEDGRKFNIDYITDVRRAASLKSGGTGLRYTVKILNKVRYLFLEDNTWFVEG